MKERKKYIILYISLALLAIIDGIVLGLFLIRNEKKFNTPEVYVCLAIGLLISFSIALVYTLGRQVGKINCQSVKIKKENLYVFTDSNDKEYTFRIKYYKEDEEKIMVSNNTRTWFTFKKNNIDENSSAVLAKIKTDTDSKE
ncbi:MAG: hypothetical protein WCS80_03495 [Bacilli bacterium]